MKRSKKNVVLAESQDVVRILDQESVQQLLRSYPAEELFTEDGKFSGWQLFGTAVPVILHSVQALRNVVTGAVTVDFNGQTLEAYWPL